MGRYGGRELGFGSDADVMFIYEPLDGADPELAGKQAFKNHKRDASATERAN